MIGITGGSGVIGNLVCTILRNKNIPFVKYEGDVRDSAAMSNWLEDNDILSIIFLAAKVAVKEVNENKDEAYDVNVNGVIQTIKAIKRLSKKIYFFYASTSHVYKSSHTFLLESDPIAPQNTYGLTKYIAEEILSDYASSSNMLDLCIGRIFSFYHATQKVPYLYPSIISRLATEDLSKPFKLFAAYSERDFLNAEDVSELIVQIVVKQLTGVFNIASGKPTRILDFVKSLTEKELIFDIDENEVKTFLVADISKLKSQL